jgi:serine/threonine protein kinase
MRQDDFKVIEKIGQGAYGEVFLASVRETSKVCVLKCICMASLSLGEQKIAEDEARILSRLHHRHIIEFTGVFMDANCRLNIAMEFADRLTLAHRIRVYPGFVPHQARNTTHNIVLGAADSFRRKLYLESSAPIIQRSTLCPPESCSASRHQVLKCIFVH